MLTARIMAHNRLNGFIFSAVEFSVAAPVLGFISLRFLGDGSPVRAAIVAGILVNCLPVVYFALVSLATREESAGIINLYFDAETRAAMKKRHPRMLTDTLILVFAISVPFLALAIVVLERYQASSGPD